MSMNSMVVGTSDLGLMSSAILVEALIGHGDDAGVGVDGAEGVVGGLGLGRGEGVEDGALADVGQADDSAIQWHGNFPFSSIEKWNGFR